MFIVGAPLELSEGMWEVLKLAVLFGLLVFLAFSILVLRQTQLMTRTVTGKLDKTIHATAWVYFILVVCLFIFSLLFL